MINDFLNMFSLTILYLITFTFFVSATQLPPFIYPCAKISGQDTQLQECIYYQTKVVVHILKEGVPELDIQPIDPLYIEHLSMALHDDFLFSLENTTITGLSDCSFNRVLMNSSTNELQLSIHFRKITIIGYYLLQGFVFIIQANSFGATSMIFDDVILNVKIPFKITVRDEIPILLIPRAFDAGLTFSTGSIDFDNMFPLEPILGTILNKFINDNMEDLYQVIRPGILDTIKQALFNLLFKMFGNIPMINFFADH